LDHSGQVKVVDTIVSAAVAGAISAILAKVQMSQIVLDQAALAARPKAGVDADADAEVESNTVTR
jgi:hypothetical protein